MEDKYTLIPEIQQEKIIQMKIARASLQFLEDKYSNKWPDNEHLHNLRSRLMIDAQVFERDLLENESQKENRLMDFYEDYLKLMEHQRKLLHDMNLRAEFDEDVIRKYLALVDIEEFKVREKILQTSL